MGDGRRQLGDRRELGGAGELGLGRSQRVLYSLAVVDVDLHTIPMDDAPIDVAQWLGVKLEPAIHPIRSAEPVLPTPRGFGLQRPPPPPRPPVGSIPRHRLSPPFVRR